MLRFFFIFTVVSVLALTWLVTHYESQANCVKSENIEYVYFLPAGKDFAGQPKASVPFPLCGQKGWQVAEFDWTDLRSNISWSVSSYDRLIEAVRSPSQLKKVIIVEKPETIFRLESDQVVIGQAIAKAQGQVFKAMIAHWLVSLNKNLEGDRLLQDVLGDFYFAAIAGGISIENPKSGRKGEFLESLKLKDFDYSFFDMCQSPWVAASYLSFCFSVDRISGAKSFKNKNFKTIVSAVERVMGQWSAYSVRPVFGHILWKTYLSQSLQDRHEILRNLGQNISSSKFSLSLLEWQEKEKISRSELKSLLARDLGQIISNWGLQNEPTPDIQSEISSLF